MSNSTILKNKNKHNGNKAYFITPFVFGRPGVMLGDIFYTRMTLRTRLRMAELYLKASWSLEIWV